jgi:cell division protein FtsI/penicillin-binding protein 2
VNWGLFNNIPILSRLTRWHFLNGGVTGMFSVIGWRLFNLSSGRPKNPRGEWPQATGDGVRSIPYRGEIQDRNGLILAVSEPVVAVCANPQHAADSGPQFAALLEPLLGIPRQDLLPKLQPHIRTHATGVPIRDKHGNVKWDQWELLKSNVSLSKWREIQKAIETATFGLNFADKKQRKLLMSLRRNVVFTEPAQTRLYPCGPLAVHTIGHVTADSGASPFFVVGDIKSPVEFAALLRLENHPVSEFLFAALSEPARDAVSGFIGLHEDRAALQKTLVDELNRIIQHGLIYHPQRFASVRLEPETVAMLFQSAKGLELVRLNRFLLAEVYPDFIAKHPPVLARQVGAAGIEWSYETALSGEVGWRRGERDAAGRELPRFRYEEIPARDGRNVVLSLDARVQRIVEVELAAIMQRHTPESATAVVVNPASGDVLACATLPNYSPEKPGAAKPAELRNRAICDVHELGSVMKMITATAAIDRNIIRLSDVIFCENGSFVYKGKPLTDHHRYGNLSVEEILIHSSNIGAAKIALRVGEPWLHHYFSRFGFGVPTGIPLLGERNGVLRPVKSWSGTCITRVAIGYGISATPLQLAMAYAVLGNNGILMRPRLVTCVKDASGVVIQEYPALAVRSVASAETCRSVLRALTGVVSSKGTAPGAAVPNYTSAGKTGTAEKWRKQGRLAGAYVASFVGLLPAVSPRLCIAIVVDEPKNEHFGGTVCGPVFARIARRSAEALKIPPDNLAADNRVVASAR